MDNVPRVLSTIDERDPDSAEELVYDELGELAIAR